MLFLPENRRMGKVSFTPKNWETGGKSLLKLKWVIRYRYYDDNKGICKEVWISDFNRVNTLEGRRQQLKDALAAEIDNLLNNGWDPIEKACISKLKKDEPTNAISNLMSFIDALNFASSKMTVSEETRKHETGHLLKHIGDAANKIGLALTPINEITKRNLKEIVELASINRLTKKVSQDKYNRCRKVLSLFYKELLDYDIVESNIPAALKKEKLAIVKAKAQISDEEQKRISEYLRMNFRPFWLYLQVFYNCAPRSSEMMRLQVKDVDFNNQSILFNIHKGKRYVQKYRVMTDLSLKYWKEIIGDAPKDWFVFSEGLKPGATPIKSYQIHKRWDRLIKKNEQFQNVNITFYQLKHLRLTDIADTHGIEIASTLAAENKDTIHKHYDMNTKRIDETLKKGGKEF